MTATSITFSNSALLAPQILQTFLIGDIQLGVSIDVPDADIAPLAAAAGDEYMEHCREYYRRQSDLNPQHGLGEVYFVGTKSARGHPVEGIFYDALFKSVLHFVGGAQIGGAYQSVWERYQLPQGDIESQVNALISGVQNGSGTLNKWVEYVRPLFRSLFLDQLAQIEAAKRPRYLESVAQLSVARHLLLIRLGIDPSKGDNFKINVAHAFQILTKVDAYFESLRLPENSEAVAIKKLVMLDLARDVPIYSQFWHHSIEDYVNAIRVTAFAESLDEVIENHRRAPVLKDAMRSSGSVQAVVSRALDDRWDWYFRSQIPFRVDDQFWGRLMSTAVYKNDLRLQLAVGYLAGADVLLTNDLTDTPPMSALIDGMLWHEMPRLVSWPLKPLLILSGVLITPLFVSSMFPTFAGDEKVPLFLFPLLSEAVLGMQIRAAVREDGSILKDYFSDSDEKNRSDALMLAGALVVPSVCTMRVLTDSLGSISSYLALSGVAMQVLAVGLQSLFFRMRRRRINKLKELKGSRKSARGIQNLNSDASIGVTEFAGS